MKTFRDWRIEESDCGGYGHLGYDFVWECGGVEHRTLLGAGQMDSIEAFVQDGLVILLTWNPSHGYTGIECWDLATGELMDDLSSYCQNPNDEITGDGLYRKGRDFFDLAPRTMARRLLEMTGYFSG